MRLERGRRVPADLPPPLPLNPGPPHHADQCCRVGSIYQPIFCAGGDAVATSCERSTLLSLYCARTGATISRGDAGVTVGATACGRRRGDPLLCSTARALFLFAPAWHTSLHRLSL